MQQSSIFMRVRAPLAAAVVILAALLIAHVVRGGGWTVAWQTFGVPATSVTFADLRTITNSLDAVNAGVNPYIDTSMDPLGRTYNYPRAWLLLARIGVDASDTDIIGTMFAALTILSLSILFKVTSRAGWLIAFGIVLAPPMLLGMERGNCDLLLFSLIVLTFTLTASIAETPRLIVRSILIILMTPLKIYPAVAATALVRNRLGVLVVAVVVAAALGLLLLSLHPGDLAQILTNTPQEWRLSYGSFPVLLWWHWGHIVKYADYIAQLKIDADQVARLRRIGSAIAIGVALVSSGIALFARKRVARFMPELKAGVLRDDVALACLSIYLLSFMLGANYDYRLLYLVGAVPPCLIAFDADGRRAWLTFPSLVLLFLWLSRVTGKVPLADEILDWLIFAIASAWLATTMLGRLRVHGSAMTDGDTPPIDRHLVGSSR